MQLVAHSGVTCDFRMLHPDFRARHSWECPIQDLWSLRSWFESISLSSWNCNRINRVSICFFACDMWRCIHMDEPGWTSHGKTSSQNLNHPPSMPKKHVYLFQSTSKAQNRLKSLEKFFLEVDSKLRSMHVSFVQRDESGCFLLHLADVSITLLGSFGDECTVVNYT